MNGLLYKDLLNLNSTMKYLAVMILIFCAIFIPMGNELPVLIILVLFGAMLPISTITYDTTARWDKYAVSLPMIREEIVGTRYQLMLGGVCVAGIVSLTIAVAMTVLMPGKGVFVTFINPLALAVIFVACGIFLGSIMLPLTLKFGLRRCVTFS
ncbi:MAG: ABC-2 transporter permease [Methanocalculaceae archaeon]|nr:ABC-2 transporter permease [Methanocalculaceae archaeon]